MRVLYLLNISNPDRLSADSGWIFADLLAPALADAGAEVTVAAPAAAGDVRCGFHRTKVPGTKYRARFSTDIDELVAPLIVYDHDPALIARLHGQSWALTFPAGAPDGLADALHTVIRQPPERPGSEAPRLLGMWTAAEQADFLTRTFASLLTKESRC
ncbi:hypothetical protein [Streptomyces rimosus]|uniref:hypothetical protein n=1 Tax=Streptomyces rimosus TaxID=1927 RepID=UPI0004BE8A20|nr:hypothetical protein [Streptomyces rimosus]